MRLQDGAQVNGRARTHSLVALSPAPGVLLSPRESNVEMSYGSATGLVECLSASDYLHCGLPLRPARRCLACLPRRLAAGRAIECAHLLPSTQQAVGFPRPAQEAEETEYEAWRRPSRWEWWCLAEGGVVHRAVKGVQLQPLPPRAPAFIPLGPGINGKLPANPMQMSSSLPHKICQLILLWQEDRQEDRDLAEQGLVGRLIRVYAKLVVSAETLPSLPATCRPACDA